MTFKDRILLAAAVRPAWQRYLATVLFLVMIVSFWWFLSYRDLCAQLQGKADVASTTVPRLTTKSVSELATQQFFVTPRMADIVYKLLASCQQYQLSIDSYAVADRQMLDCGFRTAIKLVVVGDFFNLLRFFEALQPITNLVFESCEMSLVDVLALRCSCQLSVYMPIDLK